MKQLNNTSTKVFGLFFLTVLVLMTASAARAATRIWDGGGATNNFSEAANWSDDLAPTNADDVVFNTTSTKNVAIDAAISVNSFSINSGYNGMITQNSVLTVTNTFTQSAGIFQGTAANADFGVLVLNAGAIFNAPSGTLSVTSQTAYEVFNFNGGTFNANGGTFSVDGRSDLNYFRYQTPTFNNLTVNKPLTILNSSIIVNGTLTLNDILSNSMVEINGNVVFANSYTSGSAVLNFGGTTTETLTLGGTTVGNPITVNNPNLTLTTTATSGTVTWNQKVTLQAGTLQQTAANYTFTASAGFNNPGFNVIGGTFQGGAGNAIFNTSIGISSGDLNGGNGDIGTNVANCPAFPAANYYFQQSGGTFSGGSGNAKFCDLRRTGGSFTAPSGNMTILNYGDFSGGTFGANNGTLIVGNNVTIVAPGFLLNNVTLEGVNGHGFAGTPKPIINGTFNLAEGQFSSGEVAVNGDVVYGADFTGGGGRLFFEGITTRTINLPARNILLGMTLDNPNVTVTTSGSGASGFVGLVDVKHGLFQQGNHVLNFGNNGLTVSGGTFQGSLADLNVAGIIVSGGALQGGTGLLNIAGTIDMTGGTFSTAGNMNVTTYRQTGGTFNAPNGLMTVAADWTHTTGGTFNAGTGTVKFTGYNTFNCINQISLDVMTTETFNNLTLANSFCNVRYIGANDTLIVNGAFVISYGGIGFYGSSGKIRPLGTTTIEATYSAPTGGPIVEYITPNTNFVINNPSSTVGMFPVEMNAANSTLTNLGGGRINFSALNLIHGTVNQGAGIWDITNPGYSQSSGVFNGGAAELFISNGTGNPMISGGVFNSGTGKVTGSFRMTGGTMSIAGDMDTSIFTLEGGTFNAPAGTMRFTGGNGNCFFTHTAANGTFNPNGGTIEVQFGGCGFDVNVRETFNNIVFRGGNFIAAGDTLVVNGATVFNGGGANGGSIEANGDVQHLNGGTGNTNGNPNVGTTLLKFVDTATRTINYNTSNQTYATLATLVDNPNITINLGTTENALAGFYQSLTFRQGTINQGTGQAQISVYNQSGGIYNGGTYSAAGNLNPIGNFTLSGGTFNAAPTTTFSGNFTHTTGGTFNAGSGTAYFYSTFNGANGIVDVNGSENFFNVRFMSGNGTDIASGDTLIVGGTTTLQSGTINGGTIDVKGNVNVLAPNVGGSSQGGTANVIFSGASDQTFSNPAGFRSFGGMWTVSKPNSAPAFENSFAPAAPTNLLLSGSVGSAILNNYVPLNIVSGNVVQTGNYDLALASLTVSTASSFVNEFGGTITLGGDVTNNGVVKLNANGAGCQTDAILLRSTNATQRNWNGGGYFFMTDVDVSGQSGTPLINVYNGTNSGNNGANWVFDPTCLAPTAAGVTVSGRVLTANGGGIGKVRIVLTAADGLSRVALTNQFGFYQFEEVAAGQMIVVSVASKNFVFPNPNRLITVGEDISGVDFTAAAR